MVNHYRWDFIGLSTDDKPTADTSEKVTDGSTFYCSDNSKLYVWYQDQWYEKLGTGGGGGGEEATLIYISFSNDDTVTLYSDVEKTTTVSIGDVIDGIEDGKIYVLTQSDGTDSNIYNIIKVHNYPTAEPYAKYGLTFFNGAYFYTIDTYTRSDSTLNITGTKLVPNVVDTTGSSETSVMTQKATSEMVFADPGTDTKIKIGSGATAGYSEGIAIGNLAGANAGSGAIAIGSSSSISGSSGVCLGALAKVDDSYGVSIGANSTAKGTSSISIGGGNNSSSASKANALSAIAIGSRAQSYLAHSVALGEASKTTRVGEVNIGATTHVGYNNTDYRILGGVYDGQDLHDCATVAQGNTLSSSAPTTSTVGVLGQLYTDTTNIHTYQCTAIDTTDPDNPSYTWTQRW